MVFIDKTRPTKIIEEPLSNEPQLETEKHLQAILLLLSCLQWWWRHRNDFFAAGNLTIYYDRTIPNKRKFTGPDFFVVLNTEKRLRNSWAVWLENNQFPNVIVEILSRKTAKIDRTSKKELYQNVFRTPEYFWFHPHTLEFRGFRLIDGVYQDILPTPAGWLWSEQLCLYLGIFEQNLRYFTLEGQLVPNFAEATDQRDQVIEHQKELVTTWEARAQLEYQRALLEAQRANQAAELAAEERLRAEQERLRANQAAELVAEERLRAEQERLRAEQAEQRAEILLAQLRALGIEPDHIDS